MESEFFQELHKKIDRMFDRFRDSHQVVGVVYMLVLPLFMLLVLIIGLGALPGVMLHGILWGRVNSIIATETTKILRDLSLLCLGAVSALFICIYVLPNALPEPDPYNQCPTEPYC